MNTPVSFELAKLLKEKGYPQLNQGLYYTKDKEHCLVGWGFNDRTKNSFAQYSAPFISEVVMWLYEKHKIWIEVVETDLFSKFFFQIKRKTNGRLKDGDFNSPTEAYEAAIKYALETLI